MTNIEIFDPAMCCSTGVCGTSVDPELTKIASAIFTLEKKGYSVKRYNLANDPAAFAENAKVNKALQESGTDALPIILVDGEVYRVGGYPSVEEFSSLFNFKINQEEIVPEKPKNALDLLFETKKGEE
ncbi:arsenical resistance operon transcriptional repressor ArsD [Bacillus pumilus]|uniref:Arsenical resistance operon transcriptional repressor ArsD n=1 Tax=Bacillus pumilus TaxID=1408 RepID=A0A2A5IW53_BACPU|nr:arsenite efflux transporter metallochaperone ArsD [Bacillus pumilus]PCK21346.1 arsenical resistance operon transcriptional repressor ArsD [Bacillus pumilus]